MAHLDRPHLSIWVGILRQPLLHPGKVFAALEAGAMSITETMKLAAATAIANAVGEDELSPSYVVPSVFNKSVAFVVTSPPYFVGKEYEESIKGGHTPGNYLEYLEMLKD